MRVISPTLNPQRRRGVILLVVLAMLTLLTVIGVTFVLYSDSAESTARIAMEGEKSILGEYRTDELMAYAFGQLIYDVEDDDAGQRSGLRGHSLARDMYGYYYIGNPVPSSGGTPTSTIDSQTLDNDRPFRGTGRYDLDKNVVNFTTFKTGGTSTIRDPERKDMTTGSLTRTIAANPNAFVGGFNPPYTMADLNHVFLAKTDTDLATGNLKVIEPSFVRLASLPNSNPPSISPLDPSNSFWDPITASSSDYIYSVRPRPINHNGKFPQPASGTGDVRNLPWGTQNDSVWIDLGVPPKTAANGKRYKPLFAFLVQDLDGRVNVNVHGNIQGRDGNGSYVQRHASNQGWGAWEVSLEKVLNAAAAKQFVTNRQPGLNSATTIFDIPLDGPAPFSYAPVNYNGSVDQNVGGGLDLPVNFPGSMSGSTFSPFLFGDSRVYGQGKIFERSASNDPNYSGNERVHGATYHPTYSTPGPDNTQMKSENLAWTMARFLRSPSKYSDSLIYQLGGFAASPNNSPFIPTARDTRYDKITTMSWDLDRPGVTPYFSNPASEGLASTALPNPPMKQSNASFPPTLGSPGSDFDPLYRANNTLAAAKRLNLNRASGFKPYPAIDVTTGTYSNAAPVFPEVETDIQKAIKATMERQDFAAEILQSLIKATGAANPENPPFPSPNSDFSPGRAGGASNPRYLATRWLAQLAINIVDNLDADDVMTPFAWNRHEPATDKDYIFGHELPRVAINEVYAQVENAMSDYTAMAGMDMGPDGFYVKVYTELVNPLPLDAFDTTQMKNAAVLQYANKSVYKLDMVKRNTFVGGGVADYRDPLKDPIYAAGAANGEIAGQRLSATDPLANTWLGAGGGTLNLKPMFAAMGGTPGAIPTGFGADNGFLIVGPAPSMASEITAMRWTPDPTKKDLIALPFEYQLKDSTGSINKSLGSLSAAAATDLGDAQLPTMVLRRLADPGSPVGPTNPYIMVDFVEVTKDMLAANDARKFIEDLTNRGKLKDNSSTGYMAVASRKASGKKQPYRYSPVDPAASLFNVALSAPPTGEPNHTFWSINSNSGPTPPAGYQGLNNANGFETPLPRMHLDRMVTSPTELFTTPFCRPHEYMMLNDNNYSFCSPWLETSNRLYRWLEFVQAGDTRSLVPMGGTALYPVGNSGGRIPGKINLNTMSKEAFRALCDAQQGNRFVEAQIDAIYDQIVARRTDPMTGPFIGNASEEFLSPGLIYNKGPLQSVMGSLDGTAGNLLLNPFNSTGTVLNANPTGILPLDGTQPVHPGFKLELLNKIYSRTTTRSNCFAVWLTVGYFEVTSENGSVGQPAHVLGKELEPKLRRRFFAMVDRTNLQKWSFDYVGELTANTAYSINNIYGANPVNSMNYKFYKLDVGSVITIDPNTPYEETVEVDANKEFTPKNNHNGLTSGKPGKVTIISRGNPGPMPDLGLGYKIEKDTEVVPYFAVLE